MKTFKVNHNKTFKISNAKTNLNFTSKQVDVLKIKFQANIIQIDKFQNMLYAENRQSLLIILQGMDSAGKDGTIKHLTQAINPQGLKIHSFKHPNEDEIEHDFLWRHDQRLPTHGQITIFNRSHYENVLISKVHPKIILAERLPKINSVKKINKQFWNNRYKQINYFEQNAEQNGTSIVKIFLNISKEEQGLRFLDRIENKEKHYKFSSNDILERGYWDDYQKAYQDAINHTSTKFAPWHVVPADDKKVAHYLIAEIILEHLKKMKLHFPKTNKEEMELMNVAKQNLLLELK